MTGFIFDCMGEKHEAHPEGAGLLLLNARRFCENEAAKFFAGRESLQARDGDYEWALACTESMWVLHFIAQRYIHGEAEEKRVI